MALKDMALTKAEAKAEDCCVGSDDNDAPKYPWGLRIDLDDTTLAKLGFGLMPVGTEITVMANARVVSTSSDERESSGVTQSMGLQIVALDLGTPQTDRMAASAVKLYPGKQNS